jgi:hypothetical protein
MRRISSQIIIATLIASSALLLTACDGGRGYSRGVFHGIVIDKSEDEILGKLGKPEAVEKIGDDGVRYVYRRKTFDPDNYNQIDERTIIDFEKKAGKMIVVDVSFG